MGHGGKRANAGRKRKLAHREEEYVLNGIWKAFGGSPEKAVEILHDSLTSEDGKVREKALSIYWDVVRYTIDRTYGKPAQRTQITGEGGQQIQLIVDL
ncbi:MAG: hypothetical protein WAO35_13405 [Terriglobia bacterium]